MRVPASPFLAVVCWLAFAAPSHAADPYFYPRKVPVLSVVLPDGWTANEQDGPAQLLLSSPPGDPTYIISVMTLPTVGGKPDLKDILTRITRAGAEGSGMTDIVVSDAKEEPINGSSRVFTRVTASGKHDDETSAFTYYAFTMPGDGRTYAIGVAGLQVMIDAHRAEFETAAKSIRPAK